MYIEICEKLYFAEARRETPSKASAKQILIKVCDLWRYAGALLPSL